MGASTREDELEWGSTMECRRRGSRYGEKWSPVDTNASSTRSPRPGLMITNPYPEASDASSLPACKIDSVDQEPEKMDSTLDGRDAKMTQYMSVYCVTIYCIYVLYTMSLRVVLLAYS
ncbi:hypothetical protein VKT23_012997 [Stygiomarasmius scandens]|uniref:Uncharacterized protein n=1 Tax=Marasmiellus scandens TaxID=2682957 RepID=A0ABR1J5G9_9AGAR